MLTSYVNKKVLKTTNPAPAFGRSVRKFDIMSNIWLLLVHSHTICNRNNITGFVRTWKNLENLEKSLFFKKLREAQGNSGKVLKNHANSGKTQGIFSALHQQKKILHKG